MGFRIADKGTHVEVAMEGFVTADEARAHFERLGLVVATQRARLGRARVVVDTTTAQPQSPDLAVLLGDSARRLYTDQDRVAVLTSSSLLRMQMKRVLTERAFPTFDIRTDAEAHALS